MKTKMRFKLSGNWYYAPSEFITDIETAVATAYNIEGELSVWNEQKNGWEVLVAEGEYEYEREIADENLAKYITNKSQREALLDCDKCDYNFLFAKTDDYFLMGAGRINLVDGIVTGRHRRLGGKIPNCKLEEYGIDLSKAPEERLIEAPNDKKTPCEISEWLC